MVNGVELRQLTYVEAVVAHGGFGRAAQHLRGCGSARSRRSDPFDLSGALAAFHRRHPGVELVLRPGRVAELLDDLEPDRIDLAICPCPATCPRTSPPTACSPTSWC